MLLLTFFFCYHFYLSPKYFLQWITVSPNSTTLYYPQIGILAIYLYRYDYMPVFHLTALVNSMVVDTESTEHFDICYLFPCHLSFVAVECHSVVIVAFRTGRFHELKLKSF